MIENQKSPKDDPVKRRLDFEDDKEDQKDATKEKAQAKRKIPDVTEPQLRKKKINNRNIPNIVSIYNISPIPIGIAIISEFVLVLQFKTFNLYKLTAPS